MRLKRKNAGLDAAGQAAQDAADDAALAAEEAAEAAESGAVAAQASGPVDFEDLDPDAVFIDLGSLLVQPPDGLELRLQVEEETGEVLAVLVVGDEGLVEMRAFAAARGGEMWEDVRREIAADSTQRGGTATEQEGPFGTELYCEVPVTGPDGESLIQPSRIVGWTGSRWFLRATIAGRPAQDPEYARPFEDTIRTLAVRRGAGAMAPGEPLPLHLPPEARQVSEDD
ncbi:MAG: DUF3710 domain-containing protein [Marmoricola sp.]